MQPATSHPSSDDAFARLVRIASASGPDARRAADFLLAWHNAEDHGGWNPRDLWLLDKRTAQDILDVLKSIRKSSPFLEQPGLTREIALLTRIWRAPRPQSRAEEQF